MHHLNRRTLLQSTSMGTLALASMAGESVQARDADESPLLVKQSHFPAKVKRVIHIFCNGGPSQMDTFYPKPELNRLNGKPLPDSAKQKLQRTQLNRVGEIFGSPFKFKRHGESGLPVSELFPNVAKLSLIHI